MSYFRFIVVMTSLAVLSGCVPGTGHVPAGASQAKYEQHKANRESYMYEGL